MEWRTDEIIAYYVDKGLRILLWPVQVSFYRGFEILKKFQKIFFETLGSDWLDKIFKNFLQNFKLPFFEQFCYLSKKILSLHYASIFNTPINRRLQTLCISVLIYLFLAGAQTTMILLGLIFFWSEKWVYLGCP